MDYARNKKLGFLISTVLVLAVMLTYIYSYLFLENRVESVIASYRAPENYVGTTLRIPTKPLKLSHNNTDIIIIQTATLQTWVESYQRDYTQQTAIRPNFDTINDYLNQLALKVNQPAINARLDYKDGKITAFDFPTKGQALNNAKTDANILDAFTTDKDSAELVFDETNPQITLEQIENLGIKKLLGRGESDFSNSSGARITNIKVSSHLFNGLLLKPGEEFSFNKILGDVDAVNGYLPELVIKERSLVKEYGGGICQVATTVFRAAIFSGLKILERHPHAFPVSHYNPQGFDATIYPGSANLRFANDTPSNLLVQTYIVGHKIYFDFYGNDDRTIAVTTPSQYDTKPDGSLKAVFSRTITQPGGTKNKEEFYSSYKSPLLFPVLRNPLD